MNAPLLQLTTFPPWPQTETLNSEPPQDTTTDSSSDLARIIGNNLRRMRKQQQLSLESLARISRVSRAMLSQIGLGRSTPSISVLWKIAVSLDAAISALLCANLMDEVYLSAASEGKWLSSAGSGFRSRALFPFDKPRRVEFYELRINSGAVENASPHAPGTIENLVINHGTVEITVGEDLYRLASGDAILFKADVAHNLS